MVAIVGIVLTFAFLAFIKTPGYALNAPANSVNLPNDTQGSSFDSSNMTNAQANNVEGTSVRYSEGIKVYSDYPNELQGINWGSIIIGKASYYHIIVTNVGDHPVILKLSVTNWTPGVSGSVSWNYNGEAVPINGKVSIELSLLIRSATGNTFYNNIVVTSTAP